MNEKRLSDKVAIYIRVSTGRQAERDSPQVQRRELIAYSELILGINDYVIFDDLGYSGKNTDRPRFQEMIERVRQGEFSHILVYKIDRISRNLLDFAQMYSELKKAGITFVSKTEQFDTSTAIGEAMLKIILVFAELERQMTAERVSGVMLSRAANGQWNGGRIPYGYIRKENQFIPDAKESQIVKKIFELYECSQSTLYISNFLNNSGIKTHSGGMWNTTGIHKILKNVFYIGQYKYNVHDYNRHSKREESEWVIIKDHHTPIIDQDQFNRVQYRLSRKKRGGNERGETHISKNIHIFSGLLQCGKCGSNMSATSGRRQADGYKPSVYGCSKRRNSSSECDNKFISDKTIGCFVFNFISHVLTSKNIVTANTSISVFESYVLDGLSLSSVKSTRGLDSFLALIKRGSTGFEISALSNFHKQEDSDELTNLKSQKIKLENSLNRLKSLYLYNEQAMTEQEFLSERNALNDRLLSVNSKILASSGENQYSAEFIEKGSYFIMIENLISSNEINFEKMVHTIDNSIIKIFIQKVISKIIVTDSIVTEIDFCNGIQVKFLYE